MPFIGEEQVRRIGQAVDLVQLMSEYTPLRKAGANFTGCCAFHQERSPSMHVYPGDQHYHCFGCGAHGTVFNLIMEKEHVSFPDAVELLARRAGIRIVYEERAGGTPRGERDRFAAAVEFACGFYERCLWESPGAAQARAYLEKRRLSPEICRRFRLGWAPGSGQLLSAARQSGLANDALLRTDLAIDRDGRLGDRFYERVTFPICDRFGAPIAFSARLLPEAERAAKEAGRGVGKYVNSTDTPLYHKGSVVFNLHRARTAARDRNRLIVMEGPTDVMAADQAGYAECVAVLGTALTPDHAKQLGNLVGREGRLIILLDGDRAGVANALKACRTCLAAGVPAWIALLPDELDPAELLAEGLAGGQEAAETARATFEKVLSAARPETDHLLRAVAPRPYDLDHRARIGALDEILAALRPMPDADLRTLALRDAATWLGIEQDRLDRRLAEGKAPAPTAAAETAEKTTVEPPSPAGEVVLHILVRHPELRAPAADDLGLEPRHLLAPWDSVLGAMLAEPGIDLAGLAGAGTTDPVRAALHRWAATELADRVPAVGDPAAALAERVKELKRADLERELQRVSHEISEAERARDFAAVARLGQEKVRLRKVLGRSAG